MFYYFKYHGKHKAQTCSRCTKDKGIKAYHYKKNQFTKEDSKRESKEKKLQNSQKTMNKMAIGVLTYQLFYT